MKKLNIALCLFVFVVYGSKINAQDSSLVMRAYQILGLEEDEQTLRNAKQLHTVLSKSPRYEKAAYHEPNVRALVERIHKDLDDALAVIEKKNSVTSLPTISPLDSAYQKAVNFFLDVAGTYTRVIESGQNEATIREQAQKLYNFLGSDDYKNNVALFLSQRPVFDFSLLKPKEKIISIATMSELPVSFEALADKLHALQNQVLLLRSVLMILP